jgi:hypothetical protein
VRRNHVQACQGVPESALERVVQRPSSLVLLIMRTAQYLPVQHRAHDLVQTASQGDQYRSTAPTAESPCGPHDSFRSVWSIWRNALSSMVRSGLWDHKMWRMICRHTGGSSLSRQIQLRVVSDMAARFES